MTTESILIQTLCVPCGCHCRYCLLSSDGRATGVPWDRAVAFARRFIPEARKAAPGTRCTLTFGYACEHPDLKGALRVLRELDSPQASFLQCDGMRLRDAGECAALARMLREEGVKDLNFTFYGLRAYHDRFAGRAGDFDGMLRMIRAASGASLGVSAGVPLTKESAGQAEELVDILEGAGCGKVRLFIPHEEGRGRALAAARLEAGDLSALPAALSGRLNGAVYKTEAEWIADAPAPETKRMLLVTLRPDNIEAYEAMTAAALIGHIEALDERYYAAFPSFDELAARCGDPRGPKLYSRRDLFAHYRTLYAAARGVKVCDVTDETRSGSRRY